MNTRARIEISKHTCKRRHGLRMQAKRETCKRTHGFICQQHKTHMNTRTRVENQTKREPCQRGSRAKKQKKKKKEKQTHPQACPWFHMQENMQPHVRACTHFFTYTIIHIRTATYRQPYATSSAVPHYYNPRESLNLRPLEEFLQFNTRSGERVGCKHDDAITQVSRSCNSSAVQHAQWGTCWMQT